jgi:hypothetical protein
MLLGQTCGSVNEQSLPRRPLSLALAIPKTARGDEIGQGLIEDNNGYAAH